MYFYLCTDIHICSICIYICAYTSEQKLSSCLKNWDLFFDRNNEELLTIFLTLTFEHALWACNASVLCIVCIKSLRFWTWFPKFSLMWTFWITACGLDNCLFLLRMLNAIFCAARRGSVLVAYICDCWDKSLIEWAKRVFLCLFWGLFLQLHHSIQLHNKRERKQELKHMWAEFQFACNFSECSDKLWFQSTKKTGNESLDRNCVFTCFCWKRYRAQLWNGHVICKFKSLPLHDGLSSSCHCLCIFCLSLQWKNQLVDSMFLPLVLLQVCSCFLVRDVQLEDGTKVVYMQMRPLRPKHVPPMGSFTKLWEGHWSKVVAREDITCKWVWAPVPTSSSTMVAMRCIREFSRSTNMSTTSFRWWESSFTLRCRPSCVLRLWCHALPFQL